MNKILFEIHKSLNKLDYKFNIIQELLSEANDLIIETQISVNMIKDSTNQTKENNEKDMK